MSSYSLSDDTLAMTSFDARQILRESASRPGILDGERKKLLYDAILRMAFDSNARHIQRAIFAKQLIPYYDEDFRKTYAQSFGFERQGLDISEIGKEHLYEAMISNMYAAADHIYWAFGSLAGEPLAFLCQAESGRQHGLTSLLETMDEYSMKVLNAEEEILKDSRVIRSKYAKGFEKGISFMQEIPDRSYRNNPHWSTGVLPGEDFNGQFRMQRERASKAIDELGQSRMAEHNPLNGLVSRLNAYSR